MYYFQATTAVCPKYVISDRSINRQLITAMLSYFQILSPRSITINSKRANVSVIYKPPSYCVWILQESFYKVIYAEVCKCQETSNYVEGNMACFFGES